MTPDDPETISIEQLQRELEEMKRWGRWLSISFVCALIGLVLLGIGASQDIDGMEAAGGALTLVGVAGLLRTQRLIARRSEVVRRRYMR